MLRFFAILVALPLLMNAQPPRGPRPWWDGDVAKELNLSEAQTKQITQTRKDFRQRMLDLRTEVNKAETDLQTVFDEEPVDQAKANDAINRLAAAHSELTKAVSQMDLKLRMVLTAQQWQDLKQREHRWPDRRGPGRRGAPTNPGTTSTQQK